MYCFRVLLLHFTNSLHKFKRYRLILLLPSLCLSLSLSISRSLSWALYDYYACCSCCYCYVHYSVVIVVSLLFVVVAISVKLTDIANKTLYFMQHSLCCADQSFGVNLESGVGRGCWVSVSTYTSKCIYVCYICMPTWFENSTFATYAINYELTKRGAEQALSLTAGRGVACN